MANTRRYDREFRINAVKHCKTSGKKVAEIAKELGIPMSTLAGWISNYKKHGDQSFPGSGHIKPSDEENFRLRKELADVRIERDILKKAVAIFSKAKK